MARMRSLVRWLVRTMALATTIHSLAIWRATTTFAELATPFSVRPPGINTSGANSSEAFNNSFFGRGTGLANTTGSQNTLIGALTNVGSNNLTFATAISAGAVVSNSNTVVVGRAADTVRIPGNLNVTGTMTASGSGLTNLNAGNITTGTLDNARLGVVSSANGGTGLNATGATGNFLRSNGSVWTSAPLSASDYRQRHSKWHFAAANQQLQYFRRRDRRRHSQRKHH